HESVTVRLGGGKVRVWKPDTIIDDQTLESLDTNLGFEGMQEEVNNLEACQTGDLLSEAEAKAVQKVNKSARVIGARWVCAFKSAIRVRCRIVAKDLARGTSARKMGYSSPTPSCESLHLMLILCATLNLFLRSLDISHAFMHSPLEDQIVLLRLPLSVSLCDGSVAFLKLKRALNGLRDASLAWLRLLAGTIQGQGLWSDTLEPCFYQGKVLDSKANELGIAMLLVYVDDILLATLIQRVVSGLGWQHEGEIVPIVMESDSSSAIQLVQGIDLPKRSRHIEIRLEWLRDKLKSEEITLIHKQGVENVADLFTKCLPSKDFYRHRSTLGIDRVGFPVQDLAELFVEAMPKRTAYYAFLEVCCDKDSALKRACSTSGFRYLGVSSNMEMLGVQRRVRDFVEQQKTEGLLVHVHVSTPCATGSPLRNFHAGVGETETWKIVMSSASFYLSLGDQASFELPKHNQIWDRELTHKTLERSGLIFSGTVRLCKTGLIGKSCLPIGKQLRFVSTSGAFVTSLERRFGQCDCPEHAALNEVHFGKTALYSPVLARGILNAMKEGFKESGKIKR
ncbi:unnamed protein product, partial [Cladocopium goreaui]